MLKRLGRQSAVRPEQVKVGIQRPSQSVLEKAMTDEQELMLRAVLRNQEVIMNVLADLLTAFQETDCKSSIGTTPWRISAPVWG
jgi:hypothetical protein